MGLAMDDGKMISQSTAIVNVISRAAPALAGASDMDFAVSQMLIGEGEDLYNAMQKFQPTMFVKEKADTEKFWAEDAPKHFGHLERLLEGPHFTSTGFTAGELYLWGMMYQAKLVRPEILSATPKLSAWFNTVEAHEKVQKVIKGESK